MTTEYPQGHPRTVVPFLCRRFYDNDWMTASGGALSVRDGDDIYITPSGVQKELVGPDDLFVQTMDGKDTWAPRAEKGLTKSTCTPLIMTVYRTTGAGAVYHVHNKSAVMVSMLWPGVEFKITNHNLLKAIFKSRSTDRYKLEDVMTVPIVENKTTEDDIVDSLAAAMRDYPESSAVLIRRHGMYVWGPTWETTKIMAESYDYLFDIAVRMRQFGLNPAEPGILPSGAYT